MQSISRMELQEQATAFARDMVVFLEQENDQHPNPRGPFVRPQDAAARFERLFMRFVTGWRLLTL
jgi:hypothetical protein